MKKIILHVLNTNKFSGAENVVCTIIKNMNNDYRMIYCSPDGAIREKLKDENIEFYPLKKLSYFELKRALKEIHPDIIHAHDNRATVIASLFSKHYKIISHIHGNNKIMNTKNIKTILFNIASMKVNSIIWVSESSYNDYYYKNNVKEKSIILYNIIDQNEIINKSKLYKTNEDYDVIFLGRLGYPKNPLRFIEIINNVKKQNKNIRVAIVGDGKERQNVERLIKEYNLENNVKLFGYVKNPYPILNNSKILVMTSIYEGTPMCALEAQSLGKPIVATPVDGLKKIVKNGYNGYLINDNDKFANCIVNSLDNDTIKVLKHNVLIEFNKNNNIEKYFEVLKKIY